MARLTKIQMCNILMCFVWYHFTKDIHPCLGCLFVIDLTASPNITAPPNNEVKLLTEGESISIACTAKGFPYPQVTWLTTNRVVKYTGDGADIIGGSYESLPNISSVLEINDVVPELSGKYSCQASPSKSSGMPPTKSTIVQIQVTVSGELFYPNLWSG